MEKENGLYLHGRVVCIHKLWYKLCRDFSAEFEQAFVQTLHNSESPVIYGFVTRYCIQPISMQRIITFPREVFEKNDTNPRIKLLLGTC